MSIMHGPDEGLTKEWRTASVASALWFILVYYFNLAFLFFSGTDVTDQIRGLFCYTEQFLRLLLSLKGQCSYTFSRNTNIAFFPVASVRYVTKGTVIFLDTANKEECSCFSIARVSFS